METRVALTELETVGNDSSPIPEEEEKSVSRITFIKYAYKQLNSQIFCL
jgi:hypothetical protein